MRARTPQDYKAGDKTNIREGEGLGVMGGKDKGKMNAMFDTRGKETESFQKNLDQVIDDNRRRYDRQLLSDWIVAVFRRCTLECIQPINVGAYGQKINTFDTNVNDVEKICAQNCVRKHEKAYKLY